jgi:hypothetical protein
MKNNIITFLLVAFFHCFLYSQSTLVGTWKTEDGRTLEVNDLLVGQYESVEEHRLLNLTANELPNTSTNATAVSISLIYDLVMSGKVTSTMTGQIYQKGNDTMLEVFHVLGQGSIHVSGQGGDLNVAETLFFKKISNAIPSLSPSIISPDIIDRDLIGPYFNGFGTDSFKVLYTSGQELYATYRFVPEGYKTGIWIKMKGFICNGFDHNGNDTFIFSLSGISPLFKDGKNEPFTISLSGIFTKEPTSYNCLASMNIAHAYGASSTYSTVRSEGVRFDKAKNHSFTYKTIENTMEALNFTNNGAANWVSNIEVGNHQSLRMALDTGGSFDWVNSNQCSTPVCTDGHTQFNHSNSSSFRWVDKTTKTKEWGPWGTTQANLGFDAINIQPTDSWYW